MCEIIDSSMLDVYQKKDVSPDIIFHFAFLCCGLCHNGPLLKKFKQEDCEHRVSWVSRKQIVEIQGVNEKRSDISSGDQEKIMWHYFGGC